MKGSSSSSSQPHRNNNNNNSNNNTTTNRFLNGSRSSSTTSPSSKSVVVVTTAKSTMKNTNDDDTTAATSSSSSSSSNTTDVMTEIGGMAGVSSSSPVPLVTLLSHSSSSRNNSSTTAAAATATSTTSTALSTLPSTSSTTLATLSPPPPQSYHPPPVSSSSSSSSYSSSYNTKFYPTGRIVRLCLQNVLRMGSRTQLLLCPPGKCRQSLQRYLQQRMTLQQQQLQNMTVPVSTRSGGGGGGTATLMTHAAAISTNTALSSSSHHSKANINNNNNNNNYNSGSIKSLLGRSSNSSSHHRRVASSSSSGGGSVVGMITNSSGTAVLESQQQQHAASSFHQDTYFQLEYMIGAERLEEYEVLEEDYLIRSSSNNNSNNNNKTSRQNSRKQNRDNAMIIDEDDDHDRNDDTDYYNNDNTHNNNDEDDDDEVASSGDEDELVDLNFMLSDEPIRLDNEFDNYNAFYNNNNNNNNNHYPMDPLYASTTTDVGSNNGNGMNHNNNNSHTTKLPYHRKKIRYFDQITAYESTMTRTYLKREYTQCKKHVQQEYCRHVLRNVVQTTSTTTNQHQHQHTHSHNTSTTTTTTTTTTMSNHSALSKMANMNHTSHNNKNQTVSGDNGMTANNSNNTTNTNTNTNMSSISSSHATISLFDHPMTPAMAASLLLESLCINPMESMEGMAKCYDGIVAAGVALLDTPLMMDPTSLSTFHSNNNNNNMNHHPNAKNPNNNTHRMNTRRSEIMAALAPLLITSLEPPSGEVFLLLAKLRRMCGTVRYRRRLVQRIAPALVRPPDGSAMWCLKHQNDMMAIFAATELILDAAFDVFSKGWYERGRWMLADSKRAETLSVAAKQLQNLSQEPPDSLTFMTQRSSNLRHHHHHHRRLKNDHNNNNSNNNNLEEPLAEWEVIAVDRQIRISISSVFHTDWTRAAIHETVPRPTRQRTSSTSGTSASNPRGTRQQPSSTTTTVTTATMTAEMSPRTPRGASSFGKAPASPLSESSIMSSSEPPPFGMPLTTTTTLSATATNNNNNSNYYYNNERSQTPPPPSTPFGNHNNNASEHELSPRQQQYQSLLPQLPRSPKSHDRNMELSPRHLLSKDVVTGNNNNNNNDHKINMGGSTTPLSPSASSVGSGAESLNAFQQQQHKPNTVGSMTLTSTTTGPSTAHYRMLTSTAAERKRTVAACRALRAQIQRFEDAFVQLHGRPPKGAGDRAPLATTYAQYREWKRAIRADAACRIQALFRGSRCRWSLLRNNSNNAIITRIVRSRAGRASSTSTTTTTTTTMVPADDSAVNDKIAIPFEIEDSDPMTSPESIKSSNVVSSLSPQWANQFVPPRLNFSGGSPNDGFSQGNNNNNSGTGNNSIATTTPSPNPRSQLQSGSGNSSPSSSPTDQSPDSTLINMSFAELQARKRDLKQQLKQYDMNFARKHGRMPVKSEKEPIRHLYESYNTLKGQITELERDGKHLPSNSGNFVLSGSNQPPQLQPLPLLRQISPTSGSDTDDSSPVATKLGVLSPVGSTQSKRKLPKPGTTAPPTNSGSSSTVNSASSSISGIGVANSGSGTGSTSMVPQDLTALKAEKQNLHTMLRSFEKDFFRENRRQVSSFADIRPVASQYRRYKEIKKQIASLQQQGSNSSSIDR